MINRAYQQKAGVSDLESPDTNKAPPIGCQDLPFPEWEVGTQKARESGDIGVELSANQRCSGKLPLAVDSKRLGARGREGDSKDELTNTQRCYRPKTCYNNAPHSIICCLN